MLRGSSLLALAFAVVLPVAACGEEMHDPAHVVVYTTLDRAQTDQYLQPFYVDVAGVQLELVRDTAAGLRARLLAEQAAPVADVVWGVPASALTPDVKALLLPYGPVGLERVRPRYRDASSPPLWVGFDAWTGALCINVLQLDVFSLTPPTSLAELADARYRGHVSLPSPAHTDVGYAFLASVVQRLGVEPGFAYLDQLDRNVVSYTRSADKPCQLAREASTPIGLTVDAAAYARTPVVNVVYPPEGLGWDVEVSALIRRPDVQDASKRFLDWVISDSAMRAYARVYGVTTADVGATRPAGFAADHESHFTDVEPDRAAAERADLVERWTMKYGARVDRE